MGSHFTAPLLLGVSCDATACEAKAEAKRPLAPGSPQAAKWVDATAAAGWSLDGPGIYCPEHADTSGALDA